MNIKIKLRRRYRESCFAFEMNLCGVFVGQFVIIKISFQNGVASFVRHHSPRFTLFLPNYPLTLHIHYLFFSPWPKTNTKKKLEESQQKNGGAPPILGVNIWYSIRVERNLSSMLWKGVNLFFSVQGETENWFEC